ncbi:MAG: alanine/glycine:cation symporter family protein [Micrococcus sp.]|nr:alanine/glycine:cation symporter family protein [Micrococcus sp.]
METTDESRTLLDTVLEYMSTLDSGLGIIVVTMLVIAGIYFTIRTRGLQFRLLPEMVRSVVAKPDENDKENGVSPFRAFTISAASRVGTGNVAGVAIAIVLGGPGAVFWMWVMAIFGAATAFVESALAQLYKVRGGDGYVGGPAYYIRNGLGWKWVAVLFAVIITITYGFVFNAVQSNSISESVQANLGESTNTALIVGLFIAAITGVVIFGGVRRLSAVTNVLVPVMATGYVAVALFVIILNIGEIPGVIALIFGHAFGLREVAGAAVGFSMIMMGIRRGLFSNEAGMGSVPNAAATAAVSHPAKQGFTQSIGVYFDTLIVCSATAFIILLGNPAYGEGEAIGMAVTQSALQFNVGNWAGPFLTVVIFFLAWSSVLGNTYYGEANIRYLAQKNAAPFITAYRIAVMLCVLGGALGTVAVVWNLADIFASIMATINLIVLIPLGGIALKLLKDYERQRKDGLDPVFRASSIPEAKGVTLWRDGETQAMHRVDHYGDSIRQDLRTEGHRGHGGRGGRGRGSGSSGSGSSAAE